ncbi:MAG: flagellar export protein FliJ [Pseudomonadota bacterium]
MRARSSRFQKIVKLAETDERRFAEATGASQRQLNDQVARLGELNAYRQEYAANTNSRGFTSAAQLKDYQDFLSRLDQAVLSQQQIIHDCEQNLERHRRQWQVKRQRLESLDRVRERYQREETALEERRLQRSIDDRPTRQIRFDDDS